jgi:hypothetical protein
MITVEITSNAPETISISAMPRPAPLANADYPPDGGRKRASFPEQGVKNIAGMMQNVAAASGRGIGAILDFLREICGKHKNNILTL